MPEITPQMVDAALRVWADAQDGTPLIEVFAALYRAMHVARPLSEGPK